MNNQETEVTRAIFEAIDEINETLPAENRIPKSDDAPLMGPGSGIDSLGIVLLIVAVEQKVARILGKTVVLTDSVTKPAAENPFRTVAALRQYILQCI